MILADQTDTSVSVQISHFSGYFSIWPLTVPDWRVFEIERQEIVERFFENELAFVYGIFRSRQLLGQESEPFDVILRRYIDRFDEEVLGGRIAIAKNGCLEAQSAIQAYLTYDQQLQKMGIAENKDLYAEFRRPIPPELQTLSWNLCLDEEFQRCKAVGEFQRLAKFLISQMRQRALFGEELTEKQKSDGLDRLKRCGHWRVHLNTWHLFTIPGAGAEEQDWTSEIDVRFKADGDGPFGIGSLSIADGAADITVNKLDWTWAPSVETNFKTEQQALARINGMEFVSDPKHPEKEPVATALNLWVNPGVLSLDNIVGDNVNHRDDVRWLGAPYVFGNEFYFAATIDKGWQFRTHPYKAVFAADGTGPSGGGTVQARIEVVVEHTPD